MGRQPGGAPPRWPSDVAPELDQTAQLAVTCAETLNLPADQVRDIERAAQLHDIGKAAVPAAILAEQGALTEGEQRFIRRYTSIGERLLTNIEELEPVAAIVRGSQERWDGGGYPDQLVGENLPVLSRVIAVATAFTAMTTDRPHAAARTVEDALAELRRCSGTQFDPTVVAAFTDAVTADRRAGGEFPPRFPCRRSRPATGCWSPPLRCVTGPIGCGRRRSSGGAGGGPGRGRRGGRGWADRVGECPSRSGDGRARRRSPVAASYG